MSIKDENHIPELQRKFRQLASKEIQVGLLGEKFLAMIGAVHEFGTTIKAKKGKYLAIPASKETLGKSPREFQGLTFIKSKSHETAFLFKGDQLYFILKTEVVIPERSYLRTSFDNRRNQGNALGAAKQDVFNLKISNMQILDGIGFRMQTFIQKKLRSNIAPANAPITRENKGGKTKTLIDTDRLVRGVTHKVV